MAFFLVSFSTFCFYSLIYSIFKNISFVANSEIIPNVRVLNIRLKQKIPRNICTDKATTDITITIQDYVIHAHKEILGFHSPVFKDFFKRNRTSTVNIYIISNCFKFLSFETTGFRKVYFIFTWSPSNLLLTSKTSFCFSLIEIHGKEYVNAKKYCLALNSPAGS